LTNLDAGNLVTGSRGNALAFNGLDEMVFRSFTNGASLPGYNTTSYTVVAWVKAPLQTDRRIWAMGNTNGNNAPLVDLGTDNGGALAGADVFIRNDANTALVNHLKTTTAVLNSAWHHVALVDNNGSVKVYVDGVLDPVVINYTRSLTSVNAF